MEHRHFLRANTVVMSQNLSLVPCNHAVKQRRKNGDYSRPFTHISSRVKARRSSMMELQWYIQVVWRRRRHISLRWYCIYLCGHTRRLHLSHHEMYQAPQRPQAQEKLQKLHTKQHPPDGCRSVLQSSRPPNQVADSPELADLIWSHSPQRTSERSDTVRIQ